MWPPCPVKDQETLLRAFSLVAAEIERVVLHIVGDGDLRRELEALTEELAIAPQVEFHGEQRWEILPGIFRQADLHLLASRSESSPMVVLEAAACGCPTVGTAVGLLPELGGASLTVGVADPEALGRAVIDLLRRPETLAGLGRHSQELATGRFSLTETTAQLRRLYREISSRLLATSRARGSGSTRGARCEGRAGRSEPVERQRSVPGAWRSMQWALRTALARPWALSRRSSTAGSSSIRRGGRSPRIRPLRMCCEGSPRDPVKSKVR